MGQAARQLTGGIRAIVEHAHRLSVASPAPLAGRTASSHDARANLRGNDPDQAPLAEGAARIRALTAAAADG